MKRLFKTKKGAALLATVVAVAVAGGAYAFFTSGGSGTGTAKTGTATALVIKQIGAGYDSLIPISDGGYPGPYIQDQCMNACSGITQIGNQVTLANSGYQRLTSVVVAFRNRGPEVNPGGAQDVQFTVTVNGKVATGYPDIAAGNPNGRPTVTEATFDFTAGPAAFITSPVLYSISYPDVTETASLNVALSSSANDVSVGADVQKGAIWLNTTVPPASSGDFPSCTTDGSLGSFAQVLTDCGDPAPANPGAYGTDAEVIAGNADIPAVEINVVGGEITNLSPGGPAQPIQFAITNPGSSSAYVDVVTTAVSSVTTGGGGGEACATGMYTTNPLNGEIPIASSLAPGQTDFFSPSGYSLQMNDDGHNQDNCENQTVSLAFSSN